MLTDCMDVVTAWIEPKSLQMLTVDETSHDVGDGVVLMMTMTTMTAMMDDVMSFTCRELPSHAHVLLRSMG